MNLKEELIKAINEILNSEQLVAIDDNDANVKKIILDLIKD